MTDGIIGRKKAQNIGVIDIGGIEYGNMNTNPAFYPEGTALEECKKIFLNRRIKLGNERGFDGHKVFMANQSTQNGSYKIIDEDLVSSTDDGWKVDINEDILIVTTDTPEVVIGHPVADCPVVMMRDLKKGVTAIGHCSGNMIDKKLPMMIADAMLDAYECRDEDIYTYVSACISNQWEYKGYPSWAQDKKMWKDSIIATGEVKDGKDIFRIDLRSAIAKQLKNRNIKKWAMSTVDTDLNPHYCSNYAASKDGLNDPSKAGRNFAGAYYKKLGKK